MQYSKPLLAVILTIVMIPAGYGQQPSSPRGAPQSGRRQAIECEHAVPPTGMHWVCNDRDNPCNCRLESDRLGGGMLDSEGEPQVAGRISSAGFEQMMNALAATKSEGSTGKTAALFSEDAIGSNLTTGQTYHGR